jgi:hypothetical protein
MGHGCAGNYLPAASQKEEFLRRCKRMDAKHADKIGRREQSWVVIGCNSWVAARDEQLVIRATLSAG